jgi:hypothetical protein
MKSSLCWAKLKSRSIKLSAFSQRVVDGTLLKCCTRAQLASINFPKTSSGQFTPISTEACPVDDLVNVSCALVLSDMGQAISARRQLDELKNKAPNKVDFLVYFPSFGTFFGKAQLNQVLLVFDAKAVQNLVKSEQRWFASIRFPPAVLKSVAADRAFAAKSFLWNGPPRCYHSAQP